MRLVGGMVAAALIPAIFAVALLISAAVHRPLLNKVKRPEIRAHATRLTVAWGLGLLAIAAAQLAGAIAGLDSITSPSAIGERAGFALTAEAILLAATAIYLARESSTASDTAAEPPVRTDG